MICIINSMIFKVKKGKEIATAQGPSSEISH